MNGFEETTGDHRGRCILTAEDKNEGRLASP